MSAEKPYAAKNTRIDTILVAEDSKTEQAHLKQLLEASGYQTTLVASGKEVLSCIDSLQPDLILMDIVMEGGDGYQTCRKLKRNEATKDIPIIMVSSKSNDVDKQWAIKLGAQDYIVKPYSDAELIQRLSDL